jgi:hypothetical protein
MSETTPPIPKSGGNGPFILAAVVMVLLMGGLIFWKVKSGSEAPKAQDTPPAPTTTNQPTLDEAPPPPPPIASADSSAKPDDTKPGVKHIASSGGGACGPCTGDANPGMAGALHAKAGQARSCYEHALRQNSMLAGRMSFKLTINQAGQVCSSNVLSSELGDPSVANCVLQMLKSGTFPAPSKGCVEAVVPLNFQPKT